MEFLTTDELCHVCDTYSLSKGYFDLEKCNNCGYTNFKNTSNNPNVYQKIARFRSILREFSIVPVLKLNEIKAFLTPYLQDLGVIFPTSVLLKQILTDNDYIQPCASRSYTIVFHILSYYQGQKIELSHDNKVMLVEIFKCYLNDHSLDNDFNINYNCFFAWAYYFLTDSKLLISPLFLKSSDTTIPDWFESKVQILNDEEYQETRKKIIASRVLNRFCKQLKVPIVHLKNL